MNKMIRSLMNALKKAHDDVLKYRDYIIHAVHSGLKIQSSNTFLGYFWWVLDPLMYMLVYVLVIKVIFHRGGPNYSIFLLCALVPWKWTVSSIVASNNTISGKISMLQQIYIPKFLLVLINSFVYTVNFLFGLIVLFIMLKFFGIPFSIHNLELIPVCIANYLFILALSIFIAHMGVYFRDIRNILAFGTNLWFYLSPAIYGLDRIPDRYRFLWWLNPMTPLFQSYRNLFLYDTAPLYGWLAIWSGISIVLILAGIYCLHKFDKQYTKVA